MSLSSSSRTSRRRQRRRKKARSVPSRAGSVTEVLERKPTAGFHLKAVKPGTTATPKLTATTTDFKPTIHDPRYQVQTQRPIISLAFVLPLILFYELCSIFWGAPALRSGVDQWLDRFASLAGFGKMVVLPLLTTSVLVVWHHRIRDHWKFNGFVLLGMLFESFVLGTILFCAASASNQIAGISPMSADEAWLSLSQLVQQPQWWSSTIAAMGSGIYEELIFRLLLLIPAVWAVRFCCQSKQLSLVFGTILISLIFTGLHYNVVNPAGAPFEIGSFLFRFVASIVFCFLFLFRGFGIAVGTHVAYDILAQL